MGAGAVLLVAAVAGVLWSAGRRDAPTSHATPPLLSGRLAVAGIEGALRIDRDRLGVPHVDAGTHRDAFFGLGFVQAQDRLEQLLELRRRARGRAAEVSGREALAGDRLARLLDFAGLAERQWEQLGSPTRRALEAYAAGVNARLERLDAATGERGAREPWRPVDSLAVYKLFAWSLSDSIEASLVLKELVEALGSIEADRFFPPPAAPEARAGRATASTSTWVGEGVRTLRRSVGMAGFGVGSSAFALGGRFTESGRPVLVADSHFEPTAPAALHLAHLRAPDLDVAGAALPGVPVFWWGRNPQLAWAAVNAGAVVTDLYTETTRRDGAEYHDGQRWRTLEERTELLRVRGGADVPLVVRRTARGPLIPGAGGETISVAWTGARVGGPSGIGSLLALARAGDTDDVLSALRRHHEPPIALVWTEADGGGGLQVAGWIPHRTLASRLLPLPGRARWYAWKDPIPFDALPSEELDAANRFVIAADQLFDADPEEPAIDGLWRTGARRGRLATLLGEATRSGRVGLRALAALATDDRLDRSRDLVRSALELAGDAVADREGRELAALLRDWDGEATPESVGTSAYHSYLAALAEALFAEGLGRERFARYLELPALDLEALVHGVLRDALAGGGEDAWAEPERTRRAVVASLRETWLALSFRHGPDPRRWAWGRLHPLRFRSAAGSASGLGPFPYGGGPHALLAGAYALGGAAEARFAVRVAATARFAVDADALDLALVSLAPGQSERPEDPHFADGVADWLAGRHALLATRRIEVEDRSMARLVLEPVD